MKRTYKSLISIFDKVGKDKLTTRDFWNNCTTMKRDSVYQTISRAIKDGVLGRDENGFYYMVDNKENDW